MDLSVCMLTPRWKSPFPESTSFLSALVPSFTRASSLHPCFTALHTAPCSTSDTQYLQMLNALHEGVVLFLQV